MSLDGRVAVGVPKRLAFAQALSRLLFATHKTPNFISLDIVDGHLVDHFLQEPLAPFAK